MDRLVFLRIWEDAASIRGRCFGRFFRAGIASRVSRLIPITLRYCTLSWNARVYLIGEPSVDEAGDFVRAGPEPSSGGEVVFEFAQVGVETVADLGFE